MPEDVRRLPMPRDGGFLLSAPSQLLSTPNAFEEAVRLSTEGRVVEPVLQVLTNVYFLSHVPGEGDCLLFHCPSRGSETADVIAWCHETGELSGPLASDLPTVLRVLEVAEATGKVDERAALLRPALGRYDGEAFPLSLLEDSLREDGVLNGEQSQGAPRFTPAASSFNLMYTRAWWLAVALAGRTPPVDSIVAQLGSVPDAALATEAFEHYPPTILYWMWRSYFLGETQRLEAVLQRAEGSSSRLVRDAARFLVAQRDTGPLAKVRDAVQAAVAHALDPFPSSVVAGGITFTRDDALETARAPEPPALEVPACTGTQPMNAFWETARFDKSPVLALLHPDGARLLVVGRHDHPRKGRHPSIPKHLPALLEVDRATGRATIFSTLSAGGTAPTWGRYWSADQVVLGGDSEVSLFERHAGRGVLVETLRTRQGKALFVPERDAIVLHGGVVVMKDRKYQRVPESVEVVRMEEGSLVRVATAEIPLADVVLRGDHLVGSCADGKVTYRIEGLAPAPPPTGIVFRPSAFVEVKDEVRKGPGPVLDALSHTDYSFESPAGLCLVLKLVDGPKNEHQVFIGHDDGLHDAEPRLAGHIGQHELMAPDRSFVRTETAAYTVDLRSGAIEKLFDLPVPKLALEVLAEGFAALIDDQLVILDLRGREVRRLGVGPGAALINALHGGTALALKTATTPLAILAVHGAEVRLVGAVRPDDAAFARATFETPRRPAGHPRLFARIDGKLFKPHGLEAAIAHRSHGAVLVEDGVPPSPWRVAPELTLQA